MGYYLAGFDVIGVDSKPQPHYPFSFIRRDALSVLLDDALLAEFDAIHASPPCSSESTLRFLAKQEFPDLLTPTLDRLDDLLGIPWVVENVGSTIKMAGSVTLCGTHFNLGAGSRILRRHRRFLTNFALPDPGRCTCYGKPTGGVYGGLSSRGQLTGTMFSPDEARTAMGIDWMSRQGLTLAIPPDYTRWVGEHLLGHLHDSAYARDHLRERYCSGRIERFARL